jgi:hypothetical protein
MNKVWLMGGFGNVLFQILAFNFLSKNNSNIFFIKQLVEKNKVTKFLGWSIHEPLYKELIGSEKIVSVNFIQFILIVFCGFLSKKINRKFKFATFYKSGVELKGTGSENIFGYFQHKSFLIENKTLILELAEELRSKFELENKAKIVVHYRKGDSNWALKYSNYYDVVKTMLLKESSPIIIVTDSIDCANLFFLGIQNINIISSKNALDDFKYLISCEKLYCAPSTFSWWAAHSLEPKSEVIMSKYIFNKIGYYNETSKLIII